MYLENISQTAIADIEIETGVLRIYHLDDNLKITLVD